MDTFDLYLYYYINSLIYLAEIVFNVVWVIFSLTLYNFVHEF